MFPVFPKKPVSPWPQTFLQVWGHGWWCSEPERQTAFSVTSPNTWQVNTSRLYSQPTGAELGCTRLRHGVPLLQKHNDKKKFKRWTCGEWRLKDVMKLTIWSSVTHHQVRRSPLEVTNYFLGRWHLRGGDKDQVMWPPHSMKCVEMLLEGCQKELSETSMLNYWDVTMLREHVGHDSPLLQHHISSQHMSNLVKATALCGGHLQSGTCENTTVWLKVTYMISTFVMSPWIWVTPGRGAMACRSTATIFTSSPFSSRPLRGTKNKSVKM